MDIGCDFCYIFDFSPHCTSIIFSTKKFFAMKKLIILLTAVLLSAGLHAQDTSKSKMTTTGKSTKMKDCIMMKDGKAMVEKSGTTRELTEDMTLSNGTVVM